MYHMQEKGWAPTSEVFVASGSGTIVLRICDNI